MGDMSVLVVGSERVDAGKTTFTTGLVARTGGIGFKPRAANDYWFDHDDYRAAVEAGRLYGKDAYRLAAANRGEYTPEEINPIHRLWRPAPASGTGILGREDRVFVCDRVGNEYVVNATAPIPPLVRERLPLDDATTVGSLAEFNTVMEQRYLPVLADLATRIASIDMAVVESYGDIAHPLHDFRPDVIAVVETGTDECVRWRPVSPRL
jgi:predicted P-loop ATPase/GTPase